MKRRDFIIKTTTASTALALSGIGLSSFSSTQIRKITILHTNDTHSHLDPFPATDAKYPNRGGAAKRASLFKQLKKENPNTLILDAGDMFQGTPYFNFYGGELEIKVMNMLQYDAGTIGNHEFDNGVNNLAEQLRKANFDIISSNYDFKNTLMDGVCKPYKIFIKDDIKIGIFGLGVKLEGLVNKSEYGDTIWHHPYEIADDMAQKLKKEHQCNLIICLSHLGYSYAQSEIPSDIELAKKSKYIDLIIGGHTHTFLEKPSLIPNIDGKEVIVNQVGCFGVLVGKIDFYFDEWKNLQNKNIVNYQL